ncbi:MAG: hypothetical protein RL621_334 [Bacteroidota bacterium]
MTPFDLRFDKNGSTIDCITSFLKDVYYILSVSEEQVYPRAIFSEKSDCREMSDKLLEDNEQHFVVIRRGYQLFQCLSGKETIIHGFSSLVEQRSM